jgi:3-oxoacyl-[acyl-carrier protein] reductase
LDLGIDGRKALIAGGSAGLGYASAAELAKNGVEVFLSARGEERLLQAAATLRAETGAKVTPIVADHGSQAGRNALLAACPDPDILVATCSPPRFVSDYVSITADEWRATLEIATIGPIELIKTVVPGMVERKFGRIVNIATAGVKSPNEARVLSGASRAALCNYAAAIAKKVARHNVTINNLLPGLFATPGAEQTVNLSAHEAAQQQAMAVGALLRNPMGAEIPANRHGRPEELAAFCALLCSDFAGFVVGQSLSIDGGSVGTLF